MPSPPQKDRLAWERSIHHFFCGSHDKECMGPKEPLMTDVKKRYDFAA